MAIPYARRMNLVALALLLTALIAFVAFHFLVVEYASGSSTMETDEMGWKIWPSLYDFLKDGDFSEIEETITAASLLCSTLLVLLSPFLIPVLKRSRLAWWVLVIPSGMATFGFVGIVGMSILSSSNPLGPGIPCLLAAFALNFIGLLFIRREATPDPVGEITV